MLEDLTEVPVPDLTDPLFQPFWAGLREGQLRVHCCADCHVLRWPPRPICLACRSPNTTWVARAPVGRLYSWVVVGHPTARGYRQVPYVVGVVELSDAPGVRIVGNVVGVANDQLAVDLALTATFPPAGPRGEFNVIHWRPSQDAA